MCDENANPLTCVKGLEIKVLKSNMYYIGTLDEDDAPVCRLSAEYYKTSDEARQALDEMSFTRRTGVEIVFCSNGVPCF